jgi:hypothetical protein
MDTVAAVPINDRGTHSAKEAHHHPEPAPDHGAAHAEVADFAGGLREGLSLVEAAAKGLHQQGTAYRERLLHVGVHGRHLLLRPQLKLALQVANAACRVDEERDEDHGEHCQTPVQEQDQP